MKLAPSSAPAAHRRQLMTLSSEACDACRRQLQRDRDSIPHARLMIVSSAPIVEAYGGGVETRYVCLDCGHTLIHSTGRFGKGWH